MRVRTFIGILLALAVVVAVAYLSNLNSTILGAPFALGAEASVPLWAVMLGAFLLGFLPAVAALLTQTVRAELAERRRRRTQREAKSLEKSFRRALDFEADGQLGKAAAELEGVLAARPEDFSALLHYGQVLQLQGRPDEALEIHRKATVLYPRSVAVLYQLAASYEARGEAGVAEQVRDRIVRDFPGSGLSELRRQRASRLADRDWREAQRLQERIETLLGGEEGAGELAREQGVRIGLAYQRALEHLEADQPREARRALLEILEREPSFIPALLLLGEAAAAEGRASDAVSEWREGFESTGSPVFLLRIEDHFIEREEPLEAIETLHGLIASTQKDVLPRFFLGRLYYRLEMHDEALRTLESLREEIGRSPTYHFLLGRLHQRRGDLGRAAASYLTSIQQAGVSAADFHCRACGARFSEWLDRCGSCGAWNSIELDFEEQLLTAEELGVRPVAPHVVYHGDRGPAPDES